MAKMNLHNVNMAAALNTEMLSRVPLIVVVGATGTGKTKLSVELAKKFGGEIINADSMQLLLKSVVLG
ncbi:hypothetical protein FOCC_FOCC013445 [Frankliniella occidentalis]|nr:hypothetical protein FOCC_FOCC013445 [Frankliniella occidentalis]